MDEIKVIYIDMPIGMKAYTIKKDGFYTIVLNSKHSSEQNRISYYHELFHINNNDFESQWGCGLVEVIAHNS